MVGIVGTVRLGILTMVLVVYDTGDGDDDGPRGPELWTPVVRASVVLTLPKGYEVNIISGPSQGSVFKPCLLLRSLQSQLHSTVKGKN